MVANKVRYLALPVLVVLAACSDSAGVNAGGEARVMLARSPAANAAALDGEFITTSGPLSLQTVDSIMITVTAVEAIRSNVGEDQDSSAGGFVRVTLADSGGKRINLLALPTDSTGGITLARGELRPGTYDRIRLRFEEGSARITLNQAVQVSGNTTLQPGSYELVIPSGAQRGIKVRTAGFTISEDSSAVVTLMFDANTSIGNIHTTGNGKIMMNPILRPGRVRGQ